MLVSKQGISQNELMHEITKIGGEMKNIVVSIICLTYNHEKYISDALDGFVSQKVNFGFEIIVHDDASTDNTARIITEYQKKYPGIIKPILEKENLYSTNRAQIAKNIMEQISGEYIALCEGDDYWTNNNKLQQQFDIMKSNSNIGMCTHNTAIMRENQIIGIYGKSVPTGLYEKESALRLPYFQTSSYFMKKEMWVKIYIDPPKYKIIARVGDEPTLLFVRSNASVYHIGETMSVYRYLNPGSWSADNVKTISNQIDDCYRLIEMYKEFDTETKGIYKVICSEKILEKEFRIDILNNNYRNLFSKKYKKIRRKRGSKYVLLLCLANLFPRLFGNKLK